MIKLTWGALRNPDFTKALGLLFAEKMGFENASKFVLLGREIKIQQTLMEKTHEKLLQQFGTKDPAKKDHYKLNDGTIEQYGEEMQKLHEHSFEVKIDKFNAAEMSKKITFSPQDLLLLEPIFLPLDTAVVAKPALAAVPAQGTEAEPLPASH